MAESIRQKRKGKSPIFSMILTAHPFKEVSRLSQLHQRKESCSQIFCAQRSGLGLTYNDLQQCEDPIGNESEAASSCSNLYNIVAEGQQIFH